MADGSGGNAAVDRGCLLLTVTNRYAPQVVDGSGGDAVEYYYNSLTGESVWERPEGYIDEQEQQQAAY